MLCPIRGEKRAHPLRSAVRVRREVDESDPADGEGQGAARKSLHQGSEGGSRRLHDAPRRLPDQGREDRFPVAAEPLEEAFREPLEGEAVEEGFRRVREARGEGGELPDEGPQLPDELAGEERGKPDGEKAEEPRVRRSADPAVHAERTADRFRRGRGHPGENVRREEGQERGEQSFPRRARDPHACRPRTNPRVRRPDPAAAVRQPGPAACSIAESSRF